MPPMRHDAQGQLKRRVKYALTTRHMFARFLSLQWFLWQMLQPLVLRPTLRPIIIKLDGIRRLYPMEVRSIFSRTAVAAVLAAGACFATGAAFAQEGPAPAPYGQARLIPVGLSISIGMHGDRYWDGHRYWAHNEWAHGHPHDPDPWNHGRRPQPHGDPRHY
jgi:hypothetical protein